MDTPQEKPCTKCGLSKPLSEYNHDPHGPDGLGYWCKTCTRVYNSARIAQPKIVPKEKMCRGCKTLKPIEDFGLDKYTCDGYATRCRDCKQQASLSFQINNRQKSRTANARWKANNPDKVQAYVEANKEKISQRRKERYAADPTKENAQTAAYYLLKKDDLRPKRRAWDKTHREFARAKAKRRRAQKAGSALNDFTEHQWIELQEAQGHRCYYCGKRRKGKLTQDHITPLSKGGPHTLHNIIAVCNPCNSKKRTKPAPVVVQPLLLTVAPARKPKKKAS